MDYIIIDDEPDAIVIGTGLAGLSATLNILDRGGRVVLIEKEQDKFVHLVKTSLIVTETSLLFFSICPSPLTTYARKLLDPGLTYSGIHQPPQSCALPAQLLHSA